MTIEIRKFDTSKRRDMRDLEELTCREKWFNDYFPCPAAEMIYADQTVFRNSYVFVAVDTSTEEVAGYVAIADHPRLRVWTLTLAASRGFMNASFKGVGMKLMERVIREAEEDGNVDFIAIESVTTPGERLYSKFGFAYFKPNGAMFRRIQKSRFDFDNLTYKAWKSEIKKDVERDIDNSPFKPRPTVPEKNDAAARNRAARTIQSAVRRTIVEPRHGVRVPPNNNNNNATTRLAIITSIAGVAFSHRSLIAQIKKEFLNIRKSTKRIFSQVRASSRVKHTQDGSVKPFKRVENPSLSLQMAGEANQGYSYVRVGSRIQALSIDGCLLIRQLPFSSQGYLLYNPMMYDIQSSSLGIRIRTILPSKSGYPGFNVSLNLNAPDRINIKDLAVLLAVVREAYFKSGSIFERGRKRLTFKASADLPRAVKNVIDIVNLNRI